jgi:predicted neutral ceramidase superfamily lipid hydrolase
MTATKLQRALFLAIVITLAAGIILIGHYNTTQKRKASAYILIFLYSEA